MMPHGEKLPGRVIVQKQWISIWALIALATGCAMPAMNLGNWPSRSRISSQPASEQISAPAPQQKGEGFTARLVNYLTPGSPADGRGQTNSVNVNAAYKKLDPISLGFKSGPLSADLYLSMAQMSDRGGNAPQARSMYHRTLSIDANHREGLLGLARLEDREGRLEEAIRVYRKALATNPRDAVVLNDLALCHARNGELQLAASDLETAIQLQPQKQLYRNNIAKVLVEMNHTGPALSHLSAVHPPAVAHYNVGVLLVQRERSGEAVQFLATAARLDPHLVAAQDMMARINGTAAQSPASNDSVLPTPMAPPSFAAGQSYATTRVSSIAPVAIPAETARAPFGYTPVSLPKVR